MPRLIVHIDTNGDLNYLSDGGEVELLIIDERCPRDRVYRHASHPTLNGVIDKLIGNSRIGELGDMPGTEAAIRAAMNGEESPATRLHLVHSEDAT
jgi:hypothetical protein